ncbi:MAG: 50S ribosomal protein L24 [Candidatus Nanoarchaeia archaeon]|nr:50S ribosomal protein L24 [Candidatus Nanoarchaeia archaeon]
MKEWSKHWKASKDPGKQRKYKYNAPLHVQKKFLDVNISKDLRKKYGIRNIQIRKNDTIKILRGQFRKRTGKITKVDIKRSRVYVEGIEMIKKDGNKVQIPITPSNLQITELNLDDKRRIKKKGAENVKQKAPQKA